MEGGATGGSDGCVGAGAQVLCDLCGGGGTSGEGGGEATATEATVAIGAADGAIEADGSGAIGGTDEVGTATGEGETGEGIGEEGEFDGVEAREGTVGVGGLTDESCCVDGAAFVGQVVLVAATSGFDGNGGDFSGGLDFEHPVVDGGGITATVVVDDGDLDALTEGIFDDHDKAVGSGFIGLLTGLTEKGAIGGIGGIEGDADDPEVSALVHEGGEDTATRLGVEGAAVGTFAAVEGGTGDGNAGGGCGCDVIGDTRLEAGEDLKGDRDTSHARANRDFNGEVECGNGCGRTA